MKNHGVALGVLAGILMLGLQGCTSQEETIIEGDQKVTVRESGEKTDITVTTKEGETHRMSINAGEVPADWPADIPVLPGGRIVLSQSEGEGAMQHVSIESESAKKNEALTFYRDALASGGWTVENSLSMPGIEVLTARKEGKEAMLQIAEQDDRTHIQIILNNTVQ